MRVLYLLTWVCVLVMTTLPYNQGGCGHVSWDSSASNLDSVLSFFVLRVISSLLLLFVTGFMAIFCSFGLATPLALVPSLKTDKNPESESWKDKLFPPRDVTNEDMLKL